MAVPLAWSSGAVALLFKKMVLRFFSLQARCRWSWWGLQSAGRERFLRYSALKTWGNLI